MTIDELIERLEETREELGGDAEVRLLMQPNWPFEYSLGGLTTQAEINRAAAEDREEEADDDEAEPIVFLLEGQQLGYGSKHAWSLGW